MLGYIAYPLYCLICEHSLQCEKDTDISVDCLLPSKHYCAPPPPYVLGLPCFIQYTSYDVCIFLASLHSLKIVCYTFQTRHILLPHSQARKPGMWVRSSPVLPYLRSVSHVYLRLLSGAFFSLAVTIPVRQVSGSNTQTQGKPLTLITLFDSPWDRFV